MPRFQKPTPTRTSPSKATLWLEVMGSRVLVEVLAAGGSRGGGGGPVQVSQERERRQLLRDPAAHSCV